MATGCLRCGSAGARVLVPEEFAGQAFQACYHQACGPCFGAWVDEQLPHCAEQQDLRVICFVPGCQKAMPQRLVLHVSSAARRLALDLEGCSQTEACTQCKKPSFIVRRVNRAGKVAPNQGYCGHGKCQDCWLQWAEAELERCTGSLAMRARCCERGCEAAVPATFWRTEFAWSPVTRALVEHCDLMDKEYAAALQRSDLVVNREKPTEAAPVCPVCSKHRVAVLRESVAGQHGIHAACEECWVAHADSELPRCRERQSARVRCICIHLDLGHKCHRMISDELWKFVCRRSAACAEYRDGLEPLLSIVRETGLAILEGTDGEGGLMCRVCRDRFPALLHNDGDEIATEHAACHRCWTKWAEEHLPACVLQKSVVARCIGPQCGRTIGPKLWAFLRARSDKIEKVAKPLAFRQRLQRNELYPPCVQVDCPEPACLGLGYLGYDTVMCFMCEHQWVPEDDGRPVPETEVEHVDGLLVKRCPQCSEYIEKNGGCDHMTCRCKYEFWWTTLLPYRLAT